MIHESVSFNIKFSFSMFHQRQHLRILNPTTQEIQDISLMGQALGCCIPSKVNIDSPNPPPRKAELPCPTLPPLNLEPRCSNHQLPANIPMRIFSRKKTAKGDDHPQKDGSSLESRPSVEIVKRKLVPAPSSTPAESSKVTGSASTIREDDADGYLKSSRAITNAFLFSTG